MLVSDDSSTRMASLDEGKLVLRGTRTVETAGTLVAVGLLRDSSGLLLDRLVELGSSGGDKPDILTNRCYPFAGSCNDPRELRSAPQAKGTKRQRRPSAAHCTNQTRLRYGWISMYNVQKLNSGKEPHGCSASCAQQQAQGKKTLTT